MSHAVVSQRTGAGRQLDTPAQPDEALTEEQVKDPPRLVRLLTKALSELANLRREWKPRSITFRDIVCNGSSASPVQVSLTHNFKGPVEYVAVDRAGVGTLVGTTILEARSASSTDNILVLSIYYAATIAVRVTEGG